MKERLRRLYGVVCKVAFFINIGLLGMSLVLELQDLQILSILNMIFLSFILLDDTNKK